MRARIADQRGVTLVELMVTVGLFGVLSLAMMTMFSEGSLRMARARNEAGLSENIQEFSDALESYLSNATQIIDCHCSTSGTHCVFKDVVDDSTNPTMDLPDGSSTLLRFEYEDATNPGQVAGANCVLGTSNPLGIAVTPDQLILRGCKRRMQLRYDPPVQSPPAPGILSLQVEDNSGNLSVLHQLVGVYSLQCGHAAASGGAAMDGFRVHARVKARASNAPPGDPKFEAWAPFGTDVTWMQGTHRELTVETNFRNIDIPGVQFGKAYSFQNCAVDNAQSTQGDCCSGYRDKSGYCMPAANCIKAGNAVTDTNDPNYAFAECCSHMYSPSAGVCL